MITTAEGLAEHLEEQVQAGDLECPTDGCAGRTLDVRTWTDDDGTPEGAVVCPACDAVVRVTASETDALSHAPPGVEEQLADFRKRLDEL